MDFFNVGNLGRFQGFLAGANQLFNANYGKGGCGAAAVQRAAQRAVLLLIDQPIDRGAGLESRRRTAVHSMERTMTQRRLLLACVLTFFATVIVLGGGGAPPPAAPAAETQDGSPDLFNETLLRAFTFRNVGPFRMQARASAIAVPNGPPNEHLYTFYVGDLDRRRVQDDERRRRPSRRSSIARTS